MPFEPTHSGNSRGRKSGVPNKTTKEVKERLKAVLNNNLNQLELCDAELTNGERIAFIRALLPYLMPKLQNIVVKDAEPFNHFKQIDINIIR
jgi:hypothetical protein